MTRFFFRCESRGLAQALRDRWELDRGVVLLVKNSHEVHHLYKFVHVADITETPWYPNDKYVL